MDKKYNKLKYACYSSGVCMAVTANLSPLLFITLRSVYGISYSLLGLLIVINFFTQLAVDLFFSFFSHRLNIPRLIKAMPVITFTGLLLYALSPVVFPNSVYTGLVIATVIFSLSNGLAEVLTSPIIAAIPSDNPDREVSKLHSVFAWGSVFVVIFSTVFIKLAGNENWQYLAAIFLIIPAVSAILYFPSDIPNIQSEKKEPFSLEIFRNGKLWLCVFAIFLGGAAECTMSQWCSGYLENAIGVSKVTGDIFGVALFSLMLGLGRTLYTHKGKNITTVLFLGSIGATVCYALCAVSNIPAVGLIACAATGLFVSMLWPGTLIAAADFFPKGGVFIYAILAAGGDLGASVGPQAVGVITDLVMQNEGLLSLAQSIGISMEQLGMKAAMLFGALFPLVASAVYFYIKKSRKAVK